MELAHSLTAPTTRHHRSVRGRDARDKRILLIDGEPIAAALAQTPPPLDHRGNISAKIDTHLGGASGGDARMMQD
jgi:hypothetical protein